MTLRAQVHVRAHRKAVATLVLRVTLSRDRDSGPADDGLSRIEHAAVRRRLSHTVHRHVRLPCRLYQLLHRVVVLARWLERALGAPSLVRKRTLHACRLLLDLRDALLLVVLALVGPDHVGRDEGSRNTELSVVDGALRQLRIRLGGG